MTAAKYLQTFNLRAKLPDGNSGAICLTYEAARNRSLMLRSQLFLEAVVFEFNRNEDLNDRSELEEYGPRERSFTPVLVGIAVLTILFVGLASYAVSQHSTAKQLAEQNAAIEKSLKETNAQVAALSDKLNTANAAVQRGDSSVQQPEQTQVAPSVQKPRAALHGNDAKVAKNTVKHHRSSPSVAEKRIRNLESKLDEQGRAIESTRQDIASTRGDLVNTRTELTGSIARTHDEVVALQRKGERNIREFDIMKAKSFQDQGAVGIRLKKANVKNQYADIELMVDDRKVTKKHVNLYEPAAFFLPDSEQPVQVVINQITKDRVHGYVAAPKYRSSELATMQSTSQAAAYASQTGAAAPNTPPATRQRLQ